MPKGDAGESPPAPPKYAMTISRLTVDKLGIKLYDRVSAAIAEVVANSYDADATEVTVSAPMGELLATKQNGLLRDKGYVIEVQDNGIGMTTHEVNEFFLAVGRERRTDLRRGGETKIYKRKVMGRKGVGKIAPLGICQRIEVITAGGTEVKVGNEKGYVTSHIVLNRKEMLLDTDSNYIPGIGDQDGKLRPEKGTTIRMKLFDHRFVPDMDDFERQLSQRFGVQSPNWKLILRDSQKTASDPDAKRTVGELNIELRLGTRIEFREELTAKNKSFTPPKYSAFSEDGKQFKDLKGSFEFEGKEYPVTGWVGYSKVPYRDQQMSGVRIYCRGKLAAQTAIFGRKAGFTGEYDIRSYFVGMLNADWLDDEDDLILTSRQDILWSEPLAEAFEKWGQSVVTKVGTITREPVRQATWDLFAEETGVEEEVQETYPSDEQKDIREKTIEIAKMMVKAARPDELKDDARRRSMIDLALLVGPHITLEEKLIEAAENDDNTLEVVTDILRTARVAELTSFGRIADDRVKVIKKVEKMKDDEDTLEDAFQALIQESPWLTVQRGFCPSHSRNRFL